MREKYGQLLGPVKKPFEIVIIHENCFLAIENWST
jgi:hypothetical protein